MSLTGDRVLREARCWIGTPYCHQAAMKGAGTDCLGLVRGIWWALYGREPEIVPAYTPDWAEPQAQEVLWQAARRHLREKPVPQAAPGDVLLFRMRAGAVAKHLGIQGRIGAQASFVHAYDGHGVVESALGTAWGRRVVARFEFP
ncbi:NlpC/P60 family putative phage cell wall peptidase [Rhodovulum imhoffii]|uniref:NlpC/P60 family putative phage cell wall peptidase n=1 Tax=Rhodovulum imhoffii TaxID=365340 RepID=A0A2T5BVB2_9RHOB|nr:peptidase [Rhodovulum imhoffii]MBK5934239.1 peptidase [Rhodovulum imhoffii]PTN03514.1 NlpC/P60 family putative phage cell wall peptidase [Rhodovulum imhoffii]